MNAPHRSPELERAERAAQAFRLTALRMARAWQEEGVDGDGIREGLAMAFGLAIGDLAVALAPAGPMRVVRAREMVRAIGTGGFEVVALKTTPMLGYVR